jgi:TonB family protein
MRTSLWFVAAGLAVACLLADGPVDAQRHLHGFDRYWRDCNGNGKQDLFEIIDSLSLDVSNNGIPDECEHFDGRYLVNGDPTKVVTISRLENGIHSVVGDGWVGVGFFDQFGFWGGYWGVFRSRTASGLAALVMGTHRCTIAADGRITVHGEYAKGGTGSFSTTWVPDPGHSGTTTNGVPRRPAPKDLSGADTTGPRPVKRGSFEGRYLVGSDTTKVTTISRVTDGVYKVVDGWVGVGFYDKSGVHKGYWGVFRSLRTPDYGPLAGVLGWHRGTVTAGGAITVQGEYKSGRSGTFEATWVPDRRTGSSPRTVTASDSGRDNLHGAATTIPYTDDFGIVPLKAIKQPLPDYPNWARRLGYPGIVVVSLAVDTAGRVADVRVDQSVPGLDSAAVAAARRWEFTPALWSHEPAERSFRIAFRIGGNRGPAPDSSWAETISQEELGRQHVLLEKLRADSTALSARAHFAPSDADVHLRERAIHSWRDLDPRPRITGYSPIHLAAARKALFMNQAYEQQRRRIPKVDPSMLDSLKSLGSLERALDEFAQCLAEAPWQAYTYREMSELLLRLGRRDQARVCLELYLIAEPQAPDWEQVRLDIRKLRGHR